MSATTIQFLLERYHTLLLDAYGVLVNKQGPLPGASNLIRKLNAIDKPYFILTNSASRLPETMAEDFLAMDIPIAAERFITSGQLLVPYFQQQGLHGKRCVVLGPENALQYVRIAGGEPVPLSAEMDAEVFIIADQKGFSLPDDLDHALSLLLRRMDRGEATHLLLCNPDLIYPIAGQQYGFTAGSLAVMLEAVLKERYGPEAPHFVRLGKPHNAIFEEAAQRSGTHDMVMIGDQLSTDILGANRFGIDSALVAEEPPRHLEEINDMMPDYLLLSVEN